MYKTANSKLPKLKVKVPKNKTKIKVSKNLKKPLSTLRKRKKFGGTNNEILGQSLNLLIQDLLPLAIQNYLADSRQSNAYSVTNIISEIRQVISQLESSIDSSSIIDNVNTAISASLRILITSVTNYIVITKQSLPLKIDDTGTQKEINIILDSTLKEFQKIISDTVHDIDKRVSEAVNGAVKGKVGRKK